MKRRDVADLAQSGHAVVRRKSPLLTQSGHRPSAPEGMSAPF